jgi:hypothetical protein
MFMPGDLVKYIGKKFSRELNTKVGEVCSRVEKSPDAVVVEFGDDSYIMHHRNLAKHVPSPGHKEPEVHVKRRRKYDEDEE